MFEKKILEKAQGEDNLSDYYSSENIEVNFKLRLAYYENLFRMIIYLKFINEGNYYYIIIQILRKYTSFEFKYSFKKQLINN